MNTVSFDYTDMIHHLKQPSFWGYDKVYNTVAGVSSLKKGWEKFLSKFNKTPECLWQITQSDNGVQETHQLSVCFSVVCKNGTTNYQTCMSHVRNHGVIPVMVSLAQLLDEGDEIYWSSYVSMDQFQNELIKLHKQVA